MIQSNMFMLVFIVCLSLTKVCRCGEGIDHSSFRVHALKEDETNPVPQNQLDSSISSTSGLQCSNPMYFAYHPTSVDKKCCKQIHRKVESVNNTIDTVSKECNAINESLVLFKRDVSKNISDVREQVDIYLQQVDLKQQTRLDTANLKETLNNVNSSIDKLNNTLQAVDSRCNQTQGDADNVKQRTNKLDKDTTILKNDVGNLQVNFSSSVREMAKLQQDANTLKSEMSSLMSSVRTTDIKSKDILDRKWDALEKKINSIQEKLTEFGDLHDRSIKLLNQGIDEFKTESTKALEANSIEIQDRIDALKKEINEVDSNVQTFKEHTEGHIDMKIKSAQEHTDNLIKQMSVELDKQIQYLTGSMNKTLKEVESEFNSMSKEFIQSQHELSGIINIETEKLTIEINECSKRFHTELIDVSKQTESAISETKTSLSNIKDVVDKHKLESTQSLAEAEKRLNTLISDNVAAVESKFDRSLEDLNTVIGTLKTEVAQRIKEEVEQLASQTNEVNQTVRRQKEIVDIIYPNTFNKEMFVAAFLLLVVLVGINYVIVYILVKRTSPAEGAAAASERARQVAHSDEPHSPVEIYNRITFPRALSPEMAVPLDDSVAIVSFYEDAQKRHKRLMRTVKEHLPERILPDLNVQYHVIRRHENIPGIPRSKLCLMFVEFSERHVIIEEPGLGLGDLKRKTASFINRLGACLVIIYVKDPGSRHLTNGELFNSRIHCVTSQPELMTLNQQGRFLSLYDKFTDTQLDHLVDILEESLVHTSLGNHLHLRL